MHSPPLCRLGLQHSPDIPLLALLLLVLLLLLLLVVVGGGSTGMRTGPT